MGKVHLLMGAVLIGGLFTGAAQAAVLFDEDFSSYAVGSYPVPAAPVLIAPAGPTPETDVRFSFVVGETAHTRGAHIGQDPFGPAGNQSLLIGKDNANGSIGGGSNHGLVWWDDNSPNSIVGTGRFEATVFLESGTQVFSIRLGDQTALWG